MNTVFLTLGTIFVILAAAFHLYVFFLESIAWSNPRTWRVFGLPSQEHADITKRLAFNQGFYNLFLALCCFVGLAILSLDSSSGMALIFAGAGSMVLAGVVLFFSSKSSRRSAVIQAGPPLIGIVFLVLGLAL
jgi:putative membrane protein